MVGPSTLDQLKSLTTVNADSGDFESVKKYHPQDATTNPSLLLTAARLPQYSHLVDDAVAYAKKCDGDVHMAMDKLIINFGVEYLKIIPGRVSTEVDATLSHSTEKTIEKAKSLIRLYEEMGYTRDRVLIKVAATWEGIQAAKILEKEEGINCNLTLIFSLPQAIACAEANATLISPFVGRILDWYQNKQGIVYSNPAEDPGVIFVKKAYDYLKHYGYKTIVMGASFRNIGEIIELAGVDYLTISPKLLEELSAAQVPITPKLSPEEARKKTIKRMSFLEDEQLFRASLAEDQMASELLADGIHRFAQDAKTLENWLLERF